ncbi:uncharacterized protein LOC136093416 [Hydra vulgaris]|uniref:uncharacterized protein LOC136093416 n=1 Tax=Hydra vulgaris TaxID=6087 RepID=UPI0032EA687C
MFILFYICLLHCYFLFEHDIYELEDSGPIGLGLMVVVVECFLQFHESNAIAQAISNNIQLKSFKRYVEDSHSCFNSTEDAKKFLILLNNQHKNIQYTMEIENENNTLNFLDVTISNNKTGFVHRALYLCSDNNIEQELLFLVDVFVENGYKKTNLEHIIKTTKENLHNKKQNIETQHSSIASKNISLPWIPGISPKLKKAFKKAGYTPVFKSPKNLQHILTTKNKPPLPINSYPGVYKLECSCKKCYIGETKLKISSRIYQHQKNTYEGNWDYSAIAEHSKNCHGNFTRNNKNTLKVEINNFNRKVREALEIQRHECSPSDGGLNQDDGGYVTTSFWKPMFRYLNEKKLSH